MSPPWHRGLAMKTSILKSAVLGWLSIALLLLSMSVAQAEGGCPPGHYPYSIGNAHGQPGPQGCAPIPGYNNQPQPQSRQSSPPPPQWVDYWGAIATAPDQGVIGVSTNLSSDSEAKHAALSDCHSKGGLNCKIGLSYRNQCIAFIGAHLGYGLDVGPTPTAASEKTLKDCTDSGLTNCHVIYTGCSLPVRIR